VISKRAVQQFLARKLDHYDYLKDLPESELDAMLAELDPPPTFATPPFRHQKVMFLLGATLRQFLFFADMGLGKTAVALNLIKWLGSKPALVCVPNVVNISNWLPEIARHAPGLVATPLLGSSRERQREINSKDKPNLYIINYAGLVALFTYRENKETLLNTDAVDLFAGTLGTLILDECHKIKNHRSWTYKICSRIASGCENRFGMTGTPFGRDPHDLWAQFFCIDRGHTFGYTLSIFRAAYFKTHINRWGGYEYTLKEDMKGAMYKATKNRSIRYKAEACVDLPPRSVSLFEVPMPIEAKKHYKEIVQAVRASKGNYREMENAFIRLRMLTSGIVPLVTEEGKRVEVELKENPKIEALLELVDELPDGRKMVVFNEFIYTGEMICRALKQAKVPHVRLYGGTKNKGAVLEQFQTDPKCRVLVANNDSGSAGLNLQVANYMVIHEMPTSPITHEQMLRRLHRTGQTRKVFIHYITVVGSVDEKLYQYLKEGKDLFKALVEGEAVV